MNTELSIEKKISLFFKSKREESGMSRTELAKILTVDASVVANYELLRNNIQLPVFIKLTEVFLLSETTFGSFIRDLSFMDFEDERPSAINAGRELALTMGDVLSESEVDKDIDEDLCKPQKLKNWEARMMTKEQIEDHERGHIVLNNKDFDGLTKKLKDPPEPSEKLKEVRKKYLESKKPTNGFGSGEKKKVVTGKRAILKVNGETIGPLTTPDSHLEWTAGSENINVQKEPEPIVIMEEYAKDPKLDTTSKTDNISWDE
jgi:transcriptional regulator with XRE-family HTH domain